jgi:enoyl-CoA hydratase/carnithine racemase
MVDQRDKHGNEHGNEHGHEHGNEHENQPAHDSTALQAGSPTLHIDEASGRATLSLQRPQQLNRLHREDLLAMQQLLAHLAELTATNTGLRVLVLQSTGPVFCAGFNLQEIGQSAQTAAAGPQLFEHTVEALAALRLPTVARLQGGVYGGATDLALACDFRIGVPDTVLRMPAAHIGLHFYPAGLRRFVAKLGLAQAKRLFLLGPTLPAEELLRIGYLDRLVPADTLDAEVDALAAALAAAAPLAVQGMKLSLDEIAAGSFDIARLRAREARCAASEDLQEGLQALAEKRPPRFSGR